MLPWFLKCQPLVPRPEKAKGKSKSAKKKAAAQKKAALQAQEAAAVAAPAAASSAHEAAASPAASPSATTPSIAAEFETYNFPAGSAQPSLLSQLLDADNAVVSRESWRMGGGCS